MLTATTNRTGETCHVPTREDVANLRVGDLALNSFGRLAKVTEIFARKEDISGRLFVCYYTAFGANGGAMSGSMKEGERIAYVCKATAAEMDEAAARAV